MGGGSGAILPLQKFFEPLRHFFDALKKNLFPTGAFFAMHKFAVAPWHFFNSPFFLRFAKKSTAKLTVYRFFPVRVVAKMPVKVHFSGKRTLGAKSAGGALFRNGECPSGTFLRKFQNDCAPSPGIFEILSQTQCPLASL